MISLCNRTKNGVPNFLGLLSAHLTHGPGAVDIIIPKDLIQKWNLNACIRSITWDLELRMTCGNVYSGQVHITIMEGELCQCRLEQKRQVGSPWEQFPRWEPGMWGCSSWPIGHRAVTPPENIKTKEYFWTSQKYQNPEIHSKKLTPQICCMRAHTSIKHRNKECRRHSLQLTTWLQQVQAVMANTVM